MRWRARCVLLLLAVLFAGFITLVCASLARAAGTPTRIDPDHVTAGSGNTTLTITGSGFNGFEGLVFNGTSYSVTFVSSHQVTATIPAAQLKAIGSYPVYVNSDPSLVFRFRVLSPLLPISSYIPTQFAAGVSTPVTVLGKNFDSSSTILFDWQPVTTTFVSSTQLTGTVPGGIISQTQTHHIFVYAGAFTAASIGTLQSLSVIGSDKPEISLSNVPIGTSLTGTATISALQGAVTLSTPFFTISGTNSADFSKTGGTCANAKPLSAGASCSVQITATPAAFPTPPPGWQPANSYALNFEIVDNANRVPNATPHVQKVTTAGTSGALSAVPGSGLPAGAILTSALDDAGTGYAVNDTFTVNGGTASAAGQVSSVGGGGAVTGITIYVPGSGYSLGTHLATTATSGSGTGMTVDVSAVAPGPWNESGGTTVDGSVTWTDQGPYVLNVSESATLTVNSNAANNPQSVPLNLTKTSPLGGSVALSAGGAALYSVDYDFGSVTQSTPTSRTVTLQNAGLGYMNLSTPFYAFSGTNAADFSISGGTCSSGQFLNNGTGNNPGQSCTFNLIFTPSSTSAEGPAMLTLNWTSIGGSVGSWAQVLTGTGKAAGTKIHVAWTASTSSSVTGYNVYRGTQTGGPYTLIASGVAGTSYDDTSVSHGNTYCYVALAVGADPPYSTPDSIDSNEYCATF